MTTPTDAASARQQPDTMTHLERARAGWPGALWNDEPCGRFAVQPHLHQLVPRTGCWHSNRLLDHHFDREQENTDE